MPFEVVVARAKKFGIREATPLKKLDYYGIVKEDDKSNATKKKEKREVSGAPLPLTVDRRLAKRLSRSTEVVLKKKDVRRIHIAAAIPRDAVPGQMIGIRVIQYDGDKVLGAIERIIVVV